MRDRAQGRQVHQAGDRAQGGSRPAEMCVGPRWAAQAHSPGKSVVSFSPSGEVRPCTVRPCTYMPGRQGAGAQGRRRTRGARPPARQGVKEVGRRPIGPSHLSVLAPHRFSTEELRAPAAVLAPGAPARERPRLGAPAARLAARALPRLHPFCLVGAPVVASEPACPRKGGVGRGVARALVACSRPLPCRWSYCPALPQQATVTLLPLTQTIDGGRYPPPTHTRTHTHTHTHAHHPHSDSGMHAPLVPAALLVAGC
jgi:hypothetical protein